MEDSSSLISGITVHFPSQTLTAALISEIDDAPSFPEPWLETLSKVFVKQLIDESALSSGLVHWDDPEGWDGEGDGREGQDGEHTYTHGRFMSMYGKNHYNIVK